MPFLFVSNNLQTKDVSLWWWCASPLLPHWVCAPSGKSVTAACTSVRIPTSVITTLWTGLSCSEGAEFESTASATTSHWPSAVRQASATMKWKVKLVIPWTSFRRNSGNTFKLLTFICLYNDTKPLLMLLFTCVQLQKAMCVTRCVQTPVAGAQDPSSVFPVGTTVVAVHAWEAAASTLGEYLWFDILVNEVGCVLSVFWICCLQSSEGICRVWWPVCCLSCRVQDSEG